MRLTEKQIAYDAAWKQLYRAMTYLRIMYGATDFNSPEAVAITILAERINAVRKEMGACL